MRHNTDKLMLKTKRVTFSPTVHLYSFINFFKDFKFLNLVPKAINLKNLWPLYFPHCLPQTSPMNPAVSAGHLCSDRPSSVCVPLSLLSLPWSSSSLALPCFTRQHAACCMADIYHLKITPTVLSS